MTPNGPQQEPKGWPPDVIWLHDDPTDSVLQRPAGPARPIVAPPASAEVLDWACRLAIGEACRVSADSFKVELIPLVFVKTASKLFDPYKGPFRPSLTHLMLTEMFIKMLTTTFITR